MIAYIVIVITTLNAFSIIANLVFKTFSDVQRDHALMILWYVNAGITLTADLTIWSLPIPMIMRLQKMAPKEKLKLLLTFSVGLLSCASTLARLCAIKEAADLGEDLSYTKVYIQVLCTAEAGFGACAVSMVPLRPLLRKICDWYRGTPDTGLNPYKRPVEVGAPNQRKRSAYINSPYVGVSALDTSFDSIGDHGDGNSTVSEPMNPSLDPIYTTSKTTRHTDLELGNIPSHTSVLAPPPNAVVYPNARRTGGDAGPSHSHLPSSSSYMLLGNSQDSYHC